MRFLASCASAASGFDRGGRCGAESVTRLPGRPQPGPPDGAVLLLQRQRPPPRQPLGAHSSRAWAHLNVVAIAADGGALVDVVAVQSGAAEPGAEGLPCFVGFAIVVRHCALVVAVTDSGAVVVVVVVVVVAGLREPRPPRGRRGGRLLVDER